MPERVDDTRMSCSDRPFGAVVQRRTVGSSGDDTS
jgi:hypothetical protein